MSDGYRPLSADELRELAQGVILGPEIVEETLQAISAADEQFSVFERGRELLEERREQALAAARRDPDFVKVRADDLATHRGGSVPKHDERLLWALRGFLQPPDGYALVSWPTNPHPDDWRPHDSFGSLHRGTLEPLLEQKQPTWPQLAMMEDKRHREDIVKQLGDPHDPEDMALRLIRRRLLRVQSELGALVAEWQQTLELEREQAAKQNAAAEVEDAWDGFRSAGGQQAAAEPEIEELSEPPRERPVAPQLGDGDLRRLN